MASLFISKNFRKKIDAIPALRWLAWRLEAAAVDLFWRICSMLSPQTAAALGRRCLYAIGASLPKSKDMMRNIRLAFPDLDENGRHEHLKRVWGNAGAVLAEFPHFKAMCSEAFDDRFEVIEKTNLDPYRKGKKGGIFVTAHLGNWEIAVIGALRAGIPLTVVFAPIKNPYLQRIVLRRREGLGCTLVSKAEGPRPLIRELSANRSIGLVIDARDDNGVPLPFFGMDKLTTIIPARMSLQSGCDLIPVRVERLDNARFRITFHDPIQPHPELASKKDQAVQMMTEVHAMFEAWIRERPEQWLCNTRAWAKDAVPPRSLPPSSSPTSPRTLST